MSAFLQRLPNPPTTNFALPSSFKCSFSFLPTQIPGVIAWFDASDTTTYTPSATITTWSNKGSAGGVATSTGSGAVSSTAATINRIPAMSFAAAAIMTVPSLTYTSTSRSVFAVVTAGASGVFRTYFSNTAATNKLNANLTEGAANLGFATTLANLFLAPIGTTVGYTNSTSVLSGQNYLVTGVTYGGGLFVNGVAQTLSVNTPQALNTGTMTNATMGGSITSAFVMGELLVYDSSLTPDQRQQVEGYLAWKWGLQASLASTHPYKTITPSPLFSTQAFISTAIGQTPAAMTKNVSFNPTSIAGSALWLDAADPNANGLLPANGSTVALWKDKSGTGNNMSLTSGSAIYNTSPMAVNFPNGGNGIMTSVNSTSVTANQSVVFVVSEPTVLSSGGIDYVFVCRNINTGDYSIRFPSLTSIYATNAGDIGYDIGNGGAYYVNGTLGIPSGSPNKTITVSSGINIIYGLFSTSGTTPFGISYSTFNRYFIGNVQEIIVYTGPIAVTQRQQVEGYLAWKWGLQGSLPASHSYKMFPPPP